MFLSLCSSYAESDIEQYARLHACTPALLHACAPARLRPFSFAPLHGTLRLARAVGRRKCALQRNFSNFAE
eukprot:scaffold5338_cov64-Phaeocystis_antarctica.AAC.4